MPEPQILLTGLAFGESPRWHAGRLWFANWGTPDIVTVGLDGKSEIAARVPPSIPCSIDWLPDGRPPLGPWIDPRLRGPGPGVHRRTSVRAATAEMGGTVNLRIKRQTHPFSMPSEPVRPFGLTWPDLLESVCLRTASYDGVDARAAASRPS